MTSAVPASPKSYICSYFKKVGACKYGDACYFGHVLPMTSCTIIVHNLYYTSENVGWFFVDGRSEEEKRRHFEEFYEDVFVEMSTKYGEVVYMAVAGNLSDHLVGSVWVQFKSDRSAETAVKQLNARWFAGRPVFAELSPLKIVKYGRCRQGTMEQCPNGPFCCFPHFIMPSKSLLERLFSEQEAEYAYHEIS